jgi:hypothetical protein
MIQGNFITIFITFLILKEQAKALEKKDIQKKQINLFCLKATHFNDHKQFIRQPYACT